MTYNNLKFREFLNLTLINNYKAHYTNSLALMEAVSYCTGFGAIDITQQEGCWQKRPIALKIY
jgi:hypothetical protein